MTETSQSGAEPGAWSKRTLAAGATAALLVVLADVLFFRHAPGINLVMFFAAAGIAIVALNPRSLKRRTVQVCAALAVAAILPLVETPSLVGFLWALFGVSMLALAAAGKLPQRFEDLTGTLLRFGALAPVRLVADGFGLLSEGGNQRFGGRLWRGLLMWLVPVGLAVVFALLFTAANPLIEAELRGIRLEWPLALEPERVMLWAMIAVLVWPLLMPRLLRWRVAMPVQGPMRPEAENLVFGAAAIRNSLIVFNALFGAQTLMDLIYLWGGVRLPEGISHADYAHRGAYPLIVTALLAAAFVLAAMHKGGAGEKSRLIRGLVYLWIGQNVWLVVSALLRLKLYVEAYSLSELRIAAGIWMGLVAIGLVLIVARVALDKSNRWLVAANLVALAMALCGVAWLNFPALISRYNVEHSREVTAEGFPLDIYYMNNLGPEAIPALDEFLRTAVFASPETLKAFSLLRDNLAEQVVDRADPDYPVLREQVWQSWSWRGERLGNYLLEQVFAPEPVAGIN